MDQFFQQLVNGLTLGSLYALIAVGYTVVYGIVQLINFAHGEVFMIGAFGALTTYLLFFDGQTSVWILPVMIVGAIIASVGTAVAMERVAYRPLRNAPRLAPLIKQRSVSPSSCRSSSGSSTSGRAGPWWRSPSSRSESDTTSARC